MDIQQLEMKWISLLKKMIQSQFMDSFFIYWDYADSFAFLMIFTATILYLFNRKEGLSLLFLFVISGIVNMSLKKYFQLPRPCQIDSSISLLCYKSYGFPSGAAQTATIIAGIALINCKKNIYKILAVLFAFFLCFSRIYLGVHFFSDILGGITVGVILLFIYLKIFPVIEQHWGKIAVGLSILFFLIGREKMYSQAGMILGVGIGLLLSKKVYLPTLWGVRMIKLLFVIISSFSLIYLGKLYPNIKLTTTCLAGFLFIYIDTLSFNKRSNPVHKK